MVVNVYPYDTDSDTEILVAAHLPSCCGSRWRTRTWVARSSSHERRMDFVRFTGEWLIYYVLIALGGGVLHRR